jgi:hypothetical protein
MRPMLVSSLSLSFSELFFGRNVSAISSVIIRKQCSLRSEGIAARGIQSVLIPLGLRVKRRAHAKIYGCIGRLHDARCKRLAPDIAEIFAPLSDRSYTHDGSWHSVGFTRLPQCRMNFPRSDGGNSQAVCRISCYPPNTLPGRERQAQN